jgi:hypothetical protein
MAHGTIVMAHKMTIMVNYTSVVVHKSIQGGASNNRHGKFNQSLGVQSSPHGVFRGLHGAKHNRLGRENH